MNEVNMEEVFVVKFFMVFSKVLFETSRLLCTDSHLVLSERC